MDGNVSARGVCVAPLLLPPGNAKVYGFVPANGKTAKATKQVLRRSDSSSKSAVRNCGLRSPVFQNHVCFKGGSDSVYLSGCLDVFTVVIKLDVSVFTSSRFSAAGGFGFCRLRYERATRGTQILLRGLYIGRTGKHRAVSGDQAHSDSTQRFVHRAHRHHTGKHRAIRCTQGSSRNHHTDLGSSGSPAD
jgi:hypothetical protein